MSPLFTCLGRVLAACWLLLTPVLVFAQNVGIGTTAPDASAALDIVSSSKGALLPRVADATAIATPATGLLVFQTGGTAGFYYNAGTPAAPSWQRLVTPASGSFIQNGTAPQAGSNFNVSGNGTVGGTLTADNAVVNTALTGNGASIGSAVGLGVRADGGLNIGQNTRGNNIYLGYLSGSNNTTGSNNVFSGYESGYSNTGGTDNQFLGYRSGYNSTGNQNLFVGSNSGQYNTTGSSNTALGYNSGPASGSGNLSNATALGANVTLTQSNTVVLGNGANVGIGTSSPAAKLTVQPASDTEVGLRVTNGVADGAPFSGNIVLQTLTGLSGGYAFLGFNGSFANAETRYNTNKNRWRLGVDQRYFGTDAFFLDTYDGTTIVSVLRATTAGNVGIGTAFPGQKLEVAGGIKFTGTGSMLTFPDGTTQATAAVTNTILNQTTLQANSNFNVSGNGSVGGTLTATNAVVTGAPSSRLSVNGRMNVTNSSGSFSVNDYGTTSTVLLGTFTGVGATGPQLRFEGGGSGGSFMDVGQNADGDFVVEGNDSPRLTVLNSGNVGIGTPAPAAGLHVLTGNGGVSSGTGALLSGPPTGNPNLELRGGGTAVTPYIDFAETSNVDYSTRLRSIGGVLNVEGTNSATTPLFRVNGGVQATNVTYTSDARFKQYVRPLAGALSSVLALRGVRYEWNALGVQHGGQAGAGQVGLIAQEVEKVYSELVSTDAQGYKSVNYAQLTPVLIEALKEQQAQIEALKASNTALQTRATTAEAKAAQATATLETFGARLRRLEAATGGQAQR